MKLTFYNESMEKNLSSSRPGSTIRPTSLEKYLFLPSILETNTHLNLTSVYIRWL